MDDPIQKVGVWITGTTGVAVENTDCPCVVVLCNVLQLEERSCVRSLCWLSTLHSLTNPLRSWELNICNKTMIRRHTDREKNNEQMRYISLSAEAFCCCVTKKMWWRGKNVRRRMCLTSQRSSPDVVYCLSLWCPVASNLFLNDLSPS